MTKIDTLIQKINEASSIVIGAGSGMSAATGLDFWYKASPLFMKHFKYYYDKYHFEGLFNGYYNHFDTPNEYWAFMTELANVVYNVPPQKPTYEYLQYILKNKNYHIVTTNGDDIFKSFFPEDKISTIQGSWSYLQSSNPETDKKLYDARKIYGNLLKKIENHKVGDEDIPRSDVDGAPLTLWMRGPEFLEDQKYFEEYEKFNKFMRKHKDDKILFLEMGVGRMTPMFIQEPFWEFTHYLKDAFYVNINPKDALTNPVIEDKSLLISEDINEALKQTTEKMKGISND